MKSSVTKMRFKLTLVAVVMLFVTTAANWPDPRLDAISSKLATHNSPVYCENDPVEWNNWEALLGRQPNTTGGFTWHPGISARRHPFFMQFDPNTVYIGPEACGGLHAILTDTTVITANYEAYGIGVLIHEDMHQALNSNDEGLVECTAYRQFKDVTVNYFNVPLTTTIVVPYTVRTIKYYYKRVKGKRVRKHKVVYVLKYRTDTIDNPFLFTLIRDEDFQHSNMPPAYRTYC